MEHDPLKPKLEVPEIRKEIEEGKNDSKEVQKFIDSHLEDLRNYIEQLEFDLGYYDHMTSANEFAREYREEFEKEPHTKQYSQDEIEKIQKSIDSSKALISAIHEQMNNAVLLKIQINAETEKMETLEKRYHNLLTYISPEQAN